jgi:hypothetical protein
MSLRTVQINITYDSTGYLEAAINIHRWVVWAERPLKLEELRIAIAIQPGHRSMSALSTVMELGLANVLRSTLGALIKVQNETVYLIHQSTKEFLKEIKEIRSERLSLQSDRANLHIISCLTYLSFKRLSDLTIGHNRRLMVHSFFFYALIYWLDHMK